MTDLPPGMMLDDPRINQSEAPYTYFLPFAVELENVRTGDFVKAVFRDVDGGRQYDAERMWVKVEVREGSTIVGTLESEPYDLDKIKLGDRVRVPLSHVVAIEWDEGHAPPAVPARRDYWERCLVDSCVLERRSHVDYLYREEPDMAQDSDKYPDSGWRLRGTDEGIEEDERLNKPIEYVALGAVLNQDDRWLSLIDEPVGSRFIWDAVSSRFIPVD